MTKPSIACGGLRGLVVVVGVVLVCLVFGVSVAVAGVPGAVWGVDSLAYPSDFSADANAGCVHALSVTEAAYEVVCDTYTVTATDVGAKAMSGHEVVIADTLPAGVTASNVSILWSGLNEQVGHLETLYFSENGGDCTLSPLRCKLPSSVFAARTVHPDDTLKMFINVMVNEPEPPAGTLTNVVSVEGGGAGKVEASVQNTLGSAPAPFGLSGFSAPLLGPEGVAETQAGSHPYELATKLDLDSVDREDPEGNVKATSVGDVRDVVVDLPVGVAGSAVSAPTCTLAQLSSKGSIDEQGASGCPVDTIVGHLHTYPTGNLSAASPIYNVLPEKGVAAEFGFIDVTGAPHVLYASLAPTAAGYVLRTTSREVPQVALTEITANIYGDPSLRDGGKAGVPTFTNPEDCTGEPLKTTVYMDSWQHPGSYNADGTPDLEDPAWAAKSYESPAVTGCGALEGLFNPEIEAAPENPKADSPTGFDFTMKLPQSEGVETLGTPPLKNTRVTLPEGMTVNASSANGLEACSLAQIGMSATGVPNAAAPTCPDASKIGTVTLETPALAGEACKAPGKTLQECPAASEREATPLEGSIYVARQSENPFGSLLAIYIVVDDPRTGVIVKIPAQVEANEQTGQLTTIVNDTPQFPFSRLRTHFFGGNTASLKTPDTCGPYTVTSQLEPWSAPESGPAATPSSSFQVGEAAGGGACSPLGFAPEFTAGAANPQAAAFDSPFSVSFSRQDSEQTLGAVSITTPPGLAGIIKDVAQCPEPQASKGECAPESEIGEASSAVGAGPEPYWVHGGKVFLTGPYGGGAFGLSVVVPTTAGPYTLTGNGGYGREIVRSSIRVNPSTAQVTVASDPLPSIIQGIPTNIKTVDITINRPGFLFNPTNCSQLAVTAALTSEQGAASTASAPFYAANCATLPFKPKLTASAAGQGSKLGGTAFAVKIESPGIGQANIHKVDLTIPAKLPSRLTTIQKACLEAVFNANPANCDEGSVIGEGIVHTPIFKNPLRGPAYLVSHGGAAFPDVEFVLQGENVTIVLDGKTDIKNKVTYSRFETAPDAPFTAFETVLPAGPHSAFTANVPESENFNLCRQPPITMPTEIAGQNNAQIKQSTPVELAGCSKTIAITAHKIKGHILTLTIYVPAAGKLKATGKGLHTASSTTKTRETITLKLHITNHHHTTTQLHLTYTPTTGHTQTTHNKIKL